MKYQQTLLTLRRRLENQTFLSRGGISKITIDFRLWLCWPPLWIKKFGFGFSTFIGIGFGFVSLSDPFGQKSKPKATATCAWTSVRVGMNVCDHTIATSAATRLAYSLGRPQPRRRCKNRFLAFLFFAAPSLHLAEHSFLEMVSVGI